MKKQMYYEGVLIGDGETKNAMKALKDYNGRPNANDKERQVLKAAIKKIFAATTERYVAMYSDADRNWFENWRTNGIRPVNVNSDCEPQT